MKKIAEEIINEIRTKTDIVEVISNYLPVIRKGKSYRCVCPFHDDHDPSLNISQEKQIYRCFSCGASGGVFHFVQNYEKISFVEAVAKLGEQAGIQVDYKMPTYQIDPANKIYYDINEEAIQYMHYLLFVDNEAKQYLHKRDISDEFIKKYQLGYADGNLGNYLKEKGFSYEDMQNAYLIHEGIYGNSDVFKNRIVFPIHDLHGNPVGFTARTIVNADAKYLNTAETKVYKKGELIYNYHRVKKSSTKKNKVFLVEGTMDIIAFDKAGFSDCVSTLGTAVTSKQIRALKNFNVPIYVCYDGDEAGQKATYNFGKLATENHLHFEIVDWPSEQDPDEYLQANGIEQFEKTVTTTISWIHFLFSYLKKIYNLNNYSERKTYAQELASEIAKVKDVVEKNTYYEILKDITNFDYSKIQPIQQKTKTFVGNIKNEYTGLERIQLEILNQMLLSKHACNTFRDLLGSLPNALYDEIAKQIIGYYYDHNEIILSDFLTTIDNQEQISLLIKMQDDELLLKKYERKIIEGNINRILIYYFEQEKEEIAKKIQNANGRENAQKYILDSIEITKKIDELRKKEVIK